MPQSQISNAATLMIMSQDRDVLMVRRNQNIAFAGDAYVFPGGRIQDCDSLFENTTNIDAQIFAAKIAAIRETFEETGILFAKDNSGEWVYDKYAKDLITRKAIEADPNQFAHFIETEGFNLQTTALAPVAIWCPPKHIVRRYLTWFFVAMAPNGLNAIPDTREAVEAIWISPQIAFEEAMAKQKHIIFPTRCNLGYLTGFEDNNSLWDFANSTTPSIINPQIVEIDGQTMLCIPQNIGYPHWCEPLNNVID